MSCVKIWNSAITLSHPSVADIRRIAGRELTRVYEHEPALHWIAPNLVVQTPLGERISEGTPVTKLSFLFIKDYFRGTPSPAIAIEVPAGVRIGAGGSLPCDARQLVDWILSVGGKPRVNKELDFDGHTVAWFVELGALSFEFAALEDDDLSQTQMVCVMYSFEIPHSVLPDLTLSMKGQ